MRGVLELIRSMEAEPDKRDDAAWAFVREQTFPIVDDHQAVFFWFDGEPTHKVFLIHWVFGLESRQELVRIGDSQAFYLPLELPSDARVEYKFELQRDYKTYLVRDPLNPKMAMDPFGSNSVAEMGRYTVPPWTRPEVGMRPGRMESFDLRSKVWGDRRRTRVYLPAEYKPHKQYPLLVCQDGADYLKFAAFKTVLDNLIHRHEVAPLVVAFTNGSMHRNAEYGANPKQVEFLCEELLPAVRKRYGVTTDRGQTGLMGASFGGVSTLFTAFERPEVFGKLLLQSGSFLFTDVGHHDRGPLWDPVAEFVGRFRQDPARVDAKIYMSCGTFESLIYYNRSLFPLMRNAGLPVRFVEARDGHNWIAWRDRLREGLVTLFPGHLWMWYA